MWGPGLVPDPEKGCNQKTGEITIKSQVYLKELNQILSSQF